MKPKALLLLMLPLAVVSMASAAPSPSSPKVKIEIRAITDDSSIRIVEKNEHLEVSWPTAKGKSATAHLSLRNSQSLFETISIQSDSKSAIVVENCSPTWHLLVGQREPNQDGAHTFFDRVDERDYAESPLELNIQSVTAEISASRASVRYGRLAGDGFNGELWITFFAGSALIHLEAVVATEQTNRAILYRGGLSADPAQVEGVVYHQAGGMRHSLALSQLADFRSSDRIKLGKQDGLGKSGYDPGSSPLVGRAEQGFLQARHRAVALETSAGSLAVFPAPHKFLYPLDFAENVGFNFAWKRDNRIEIGARQPPLGDGRYRPWVDCPAGSQQHLDLFLLVSDASAEAALEDVAAFTNSDRYSKLPGYRTFSSHYHMWHTRELIMEQRRTDSDEIPEPFKRPEFIDKMKSAGMDIVHLAEFHGGPRTGLSRYRELQVLHSECARLSDEDILILPGEEPNVHLGGHWISFFPKPVYWDWANRKSLATLKQQMKDGQLPPFQREDAELGTVYFVNSAEDVRRLMEKENGLMWTAHPRIKGSTGYPDRYRDEPFYQSANFFGGAWKAMPADYSRDRLGWRVLDLLDDMNQWGTPKQILGEVDLFQLNPASELYGHANINYLKLDTVPRFEDGWSEVLDALRHREYFTTTGEVLIRSLTLNGREFPSRIELTDSSQIDIAADLKWTFPLAFAEIISGDGETIYRDRIDLSDTGAFGETTIKRTLDLEGRTWVRFEVWDVAENGAFTQAVQLVP